MKIYEKRNYTINHLQHFVIGLTAVQSVLTFYLSLNLTILYPWALCLSNKLIEECNSAIDARCGAVSVQQVVRRSRWRVDEKWVRDHHLLVQIASVLSQATTCANELLLFQRHLPTVVTLFPAAAAAATPQISNWVLVKIKHISLTGYIAPSLLLIVSRTCQRETLINKSNQGRARAQSTLI